MPLDPAPRAPRTLAVDMNAIVLRELGAAEKLRLEQAPDPKPGPGQAVVRLRAAALNHRDAWIRRGQYAGIRLPIILGSDGAGVVESLGAGVDPAWAGREVVINPSLEWGDESAGARAVGTGFWACPTMARTPSGWSSPPPTCSRSRLRLSWEQAAAIPLAGLTAYRALVTRAGVKAGETVLVTGVGGGVATFALLFARHLGARVFVTSGDDDKLARAAELGAAGGVNYRAGRVGQGRAGAVRRRPGRHHRQRRP